MATTKITTPTNFAPRAALAILTGALFGFALVNLFSTMTPQTALNTSIAERLDEAERMPLKEKLEAVSRLRGRQEEALERIPAEPYAWARLSYFRKLTQGDDKAAFDALRMSDLVSPNEPRQMLERALMWHEKSGVEKESDREYQDKLWQKAFYFQPSETWQAAQRKGLVEEIGAALSRTDPAGYGAWQERKRKAN